MSSQRSMSIDGSQDKSFDPTIFNNAFLDNDPTCLDTITEEISNHVRNIESDIPETSTASTLPSKRVGDPTSVDKPSNKKPKAVNREDSLKLKKLIEELANSPSQELSISASDSKISPRTSRYKKLAKIPEQVSSQASLWNLKISIEE
ncbi:7660_t:CDS:2 [Entrophospora sp. SA101]|nr:7660_t:CDS:2 [Entrophospora sp. SA101]